MRRVTRGSRTAQGRWPSDEASSVREMNGAARRVKIREILREHS